MVFQVSVASISISCPSCSATEGVVRDQVKVYRTSALSTFSLP
ncbi:IS1 family transposase [Shigella flexneri]